GDLVSPADLPYAGEPRPNRETAPLPSLLFGDLERDRGARSDDAHFAAQHVDELRKLVDAVFADEPPDGCDARVASHLEDGALLFVVRDQLGFELLGVGHHGAEL